MNIVTTRFGLVQFPESEIIRIPEGLVGFRSFTQYVHLPDTVVTGLSWLQSVTAPELAFGLIPPPTSRTSWLRGMVPCLSMQSSALSSTASRGCSRMS